MVNVDSQYRCTIISLQLTNQAPNLPQVWQLLSRFTQDFKAILVNRPADELGRQYIASHEVAQSQSSKIKREAGSLGLNPRVSSLAFDEGISLVSQISPDDILVLLQPAHPLDRQSPGFLRLSRAAHRASVPTIYFPHRLANAGASILLAGQDVGDDPHKMAQIIAQKSGLALEWDQTIKGFDEAQHALMNCPRSARPSLLIIQANRSENQPQAFMKLAAVTGVPILVVHS